MVRVNVGSLRIILPGLERHPLFQGSSRIDWSVDVGPFDIDPPSPVAS